MATEPTLLKRSYLVTGMTCASCVASVESIQRDPAVANTLLIGQLLRAARCRGFLVRRWRTLCV